MWNCVRRDKIGQGSDVFISNQQRVQCQGTAGLRHHVRSWAVVLGRSPGGTEHRGHRGCDRRRTPRRAWGASGVWVLRYTGVCCPPWLCARTPLAGGSNLVQLDTLRYAGGPLLGTSRPFRPSLILPWSHALTYQEIWALLGSFFWNIPAILLQLKPSPWFSRHSELRSETPRSSPFQLSSGFSPAQSSS